MCVCASCMAGHAQSKRTDLGDGDGGADVEALAQVRAERLLYMRAPSVYVFGWMRVSGMSPSSRLHTNPTDGGRCSLAPALSRLLCDGTEHAPW